MKATIGILLLSLICIANSQNATKTEPGKAVEVAKQKPAPAAAMRTPPGKVQKPKKKPTPPVRPPKAKGTASAKGKPQKAKSIQPTKGGRRPRSPDESSEWEVNFQETHPPKKHGQKKGKIQQRARSVVDRVLQQERDRRKQQRTKKPKKTKYSGRSLDKNSGIVVANDTALPVANITVHENVVIIDGIEEPGLAVQDVISLELAGKSEPVLDQETPAVPAIPEPKLESGDVASDFVPDESNVALVDSHPSGIVALSQSNAAVHSDSSDESDNPADEVKQQRAFKRLGL